MKQLVQYRSESEKVVGWNAYQCPHCHRIIDSPYGPEKVYCDCPVVPEWWEFGAWSAIALQVIGLRQHRYLWLKAQFGLKPQCSCQQRIEAANTIGSRLAACLRNLRQKLTALW